MADNTAGIGVAESLINKATPPRDMAITKGLQMAQQNALKKAQLEAAAAAKRQARMDALGKHMTVETGQFKNKSVQEKAAKIGREAILKMYEAGDDYGAITRTKFDAENQIKGLHAEDDILTQLGDDKTFVDAKDARRAIEQGKFNEWYSQQHPLKQREDRKSTRLNSSHTDISRMPSSA